MQMLQPLSQPEPPGDNYTLSSEDEEIDEHAFNLVRNSPSQSIWKPTRCLAPLHLTDETSEENQQSQPQKTDNDVDFLHLFYDGDTVPLPSTEDESDQETETVIYSLTKSGERLPDHVETGNSVDRLSKSENKNKDLKTMDDDNLEQDKIKEGSEMEEKEAQKIDEMDLKPTSLFKTTKSVESQSKSDKRKDDQINPDQSKLSNLAKEDSGFNFGLGDSEQHKIIDMTENKTTSIQKESDINAELPKDEGVEKKEITPLTTTPTSQILLAGSIPPKVCAPASITIEIRSPSEKINKLDTNEEKQPLTNNDMPCDDNPLENMSPTIDENETSEKNKIENEYIYSVSSPLSQSSPKAIPLRFKMSVESCLENTTTTQTVMNHKLVEDKVAEPISCAESKPSLIQIDQKARAHNNIDENGKDESTNTADKTISNANADSKFIRNGPIDVSKTNIFSPVGAPKKNTTNGKPTEDKNNPVADKYGTPLEEKKKKNGRWMSTRRSTSSPRLVLFQEKAQDDETVFASLAPDIDAAVKRKSNDNNVDSSCLEELHPPNGIDVSPHQKSDVSSNQEEEGILPSSKVVGQDRERKAHHETERKNVFLTESHGDTLHGLKREKENKKESVTTSSVTLEPSKQKKPDARKAPKQVPPHKAPEDLNVNDKNDCNVQKNDAVIIGDTFERHKTNRSNKTKRDVAVNQERNLVQRSTALGKNYKTPVVDESDECDANPLQDTQEEDIALPTKSPSRLRKLYDSSPEGTPKNSQKIMKKQHKTVKDVPPPLKKITITPSKSQHLPDSPPSPNCNYNDLLHNQNLSLIPSLMEKYNKALEKKERYIDKLSEGHMKAINERDEIIYKLKERIVALETRVEIYEKMRELDDAVSKTNEEVSPEIEIELPTISTIKETKKPTHRQTKRKNDELNNVKTPKTKKRRGDEPPTTKNHMEETEWNTTLESSMDANCDETYNDAENSSQNTESPITHNNAAITPPPCHSDSDSEDDTALITPSSILTRESIRKCAKLINHFYHNHSMEHFRRELWHPLWDQLRYQGSSCDANIGWDYGSSFGSIVSSYSYVPPGRKASKQGVENVDYFLSETRVVKCIVEEIVKSKKKLLEAVSLEELYRQIGLDDGNEMGRGSRRRRGRSRRDDDDDDEVTSKTKSRSMSRQRSKSPKVTGAVTTGKKKSKRRSEVPLAKLITPQPTKSDKKKTKEKQKESENPSAEAKGTSPVPTKTNPQTMVIPTARPSAASIPSRDTTPQPKSSSKQTLLSKAVSPLSLKPTKLFSSFPDVASTDGIRKLLEMRQQARKRHKNERLRTNPSSTNRSHQTPLHKKRRNEPLRYHLTQSPSGSDDDTLPSHALIPNSPLPLNAPLRGFSFLLSGAPPPIHTLIRKLGGKPLSSTSDLSTIPRGTLFFLSTPTNRRRIKYIYAAALGLPMLHTSWITELDERFVKGETVNLFNSELFERKKLPTGLNVRSGLFVLQRARHANRWLRPGEEKGRVIFEGLRLVLALEKESVEREWRGVLESLGASVVPAEGAVDAILVDGVTIPPHTTAVPSRIAPIVKGLGDVPVIELSWAVQSIVQRRRLPFDDQPRYRISIKDINATLFSMKVGKDDGTMVRYEVGDTVMIEKKGTSSFGRIVTITRNSGAKGYQVGVKLLVPNGNYELMEGSSSTPQLSMDGNKLGSHIVLLSSKDFHCVKGGYVPDEEDASQIFKQKRSA